MTKKKLLLPVLGMGIAAMVAGCGGSSSGGGVGTMNLAVTDAPVDAADAVVVEFTGVALRPEGGEEIVINFDQPRTIDLLALQGGVSSALLDGQTVPAGRYSGLRLLVTAARNNTDSYITLTDGTQRSLFVPSGSQSGLKLVRGFTVPVDGEASFTIDFDLRKSITSPQAPGSDFFLKPALRIVDNAEVGSITGTVGAATLGDASCADQDDPTQNSNVVYVYSGADVTPDDIDTGAVNPISSANVTDSDSGAFTYRAAFLPPGDYTVSFTCQADLDDPELDDAVVFLGTRTVSVSANVATVADF